MIASKIMTIFLHSLAGWILCAATMGIGLAVTSLETTLIIHAAAAPIFFAGVSWFYFRNYTFTSPLQTAFTFTAIVITLDIVVVAMLINRSFEMFTSLLGTWIPFALIFASTWLTGLLAGKFFQRERIQ